MGRRGDAAREAGCRMLVRILGRAAPLLRAAVLSSAVWASGAFADSGGSIAGAAGGAGNPTGPGGAGGTAELGALGAGGGAGTTGGAGGGSLGGAGGAAPGANGANGSGEVLSVTSFE